MSGRKSSLVIISFLIIFGILSSTNLIYMKAEPTYVEGNIIVDTTWTKANSPYLVTNNIYIRGVTLTIDPGVIIKLGGYYYIDVSDVNGQIICKGTKEEPILFTSNKLTPTSKDWIGIVIRGYENNNIITNTTIEYAMRAIKISAYDSSNKICDSIFRNNKNGINMSVDKEGTSVYILNNSFENNSNAGITFYVQGEYNNDAPFIGLVNNNILMSNKYGIAITKGSNQYANLSIQNNDIILNKDAGVLFYRSGKCMDDHIYLKYNNIAFNSIGLLYQTSGSEISKHNNIYQNDLGASSDIEATTYWPNAENNYWGSSNGPCHNSLNPSGTGNSVKNVDFIPYLDKPVKKIIKRPIAKLIVDKTSTAVNVDITFDGASSTDDSKVIKYLFDFGDGTNSDWTFTSVVKHKYSIEGNYIVSLKVQDDYGIESNNDENVTITISTNQPPIASIKANKKNGIVPLTVLFTGSGTDPEGSIVSYHWNFEDDKTSNEQNPIHTFQNVGAYTVKLIVTDEGGLTSTDKISIIVKEVPPKNIEVKIGPIKDEEGKPIENVKINICFSSGTQYCWNPSTNVYGYTYISVSETWIGKTAKVKVSKEGYKEETFTGIIHSDGTLTPTRGEYPKLKLETTTKPPQQQEDIPVWIVIVITLSVILTLIYLFYKKVQTEKSQEDDERYEDEEE